MRSSKWSAHGNVYLLVEDDGITAERARELSAENQTDGVLEVLAVDEFTVSYRWDNGVTARRPTSEFLDVFNPPGDQ
jgi:hypothetical protein